MKQYLDLLRHIKESGVFKSDRTGTGTLSVFGPQMEFDLAQGFPLLTTKKVQIRSIIYELLWFLRGDTNIKYLVDNGVNIWNEWAYEAYLKDLGNSVPSVDSDEWKEGIKVFAERIRTDDDFATQYGDLGPVYGAQWRRRRTLVFVEGQAHGHEWEPAHFEPRSVDQLTEVIGRLKRNPDSRRHIVDAWNVGEIDDMALPPCHCLFQFYVAEGHLSCKLYQRSADMFLGVPFNIASYALLTMMIAQVCGYRAHKFIHTFGDAHIYANHMNQVDEQLSREPRSLPTMRLNPMIENINEFEFSDFELVGYNPHPAIKAPIAR